MENKSSEEFRKLAQELRELGNATEEERIVKVAHILCASKGLTRIQQKVRNWYEPLS